jgi:hypothetical protein
VVLLTAEQPTFAAHIMQALAAVPQLRDVFANIQVEADDPTRMFHERTFTDRSARRAPRSIRRPGPGGKQLRRR